MPFEPTPDNVAFALLVGGVCPKCSGPPAKSHFKEYYCDPCWEPVKRLDSQDPTYLEWLRLTRAWRKVYEFTGNQSGR
jgi:hypothetical protein